MEWLSPVGSRGRDRRYRVNLEELLTKVLGYTEDEWLAICTESDSKQWGAVVVRVDKVSDLIARDATGMNVYYSVCPVRSGLAPGAKGKAEDVTRLSALWGDLDVKDGSGVSTMEDARAIIDQLTEWLGVAPSAITRSGHGLHPLWPVSDGEIRSDSDRARAEMLLSQWKAAVRKAGAGVDSSPDSVFNLDRVLRAPGSQNVKVPAEPIDVVTETYPVSPLTMAEIEFALDAAGIEPDERVAKRASGRTGSVVAPAAEWEHAEVAHCGYAKTTTGAWARDGVGSGRHQWLGDRAVRLACMVRRGCLTTADAAAIKDSVWARFSVFCKEGVGGAPRAAIRFDGDSDAGDWGLFQWAMDQVSMMTDEEIREQLGGHAHDAELAGGVPVTLDPAVVELINDLADTHPADAATEYGVPATQKSIRMSQTDAGLADLVAQIARPNLRWCSDHGSWLARRPESKSTWDLEPGDGKIYRTVRTAIDAIAEDAIWGKFKKQAMGSGAIGGVAGLAKRDASLEVRARDLDSDGWVINSPGGVINLRTGLPFTEGVGLHTRVMGCEVADSERIFHPMWSKFLHTTFGGDVEMIAFTRRLAGWMSIGEIVEHVLPFFRGDGRNGKGVWMETVQLVLGSYAITAPLDFLMVGPKEHPTEIARLSGARMVICSEVEKNSRFAESKVKGLVGPDGKLTGRLMHGNWIDFDATHSLLLSGNSDVAVEQGGPSFWERLLKIPFDHYVKKEDRIGGLAKKMFLAEGPSIARWIIDGCIEYQKFGLLPPPQVLAATEAYRASQDPVGRFADDCLDVHLPADQRVLSGAIYTLYRGWCRETGERNELTQIALMAELESKFQLGKFRNAEGRHRTGVAIKSGAIASYGFGMVRDES